MIVVFTREELKIKKPITEVEMRDIPNRQLVELADLVLYRDGDQNKIIKDRNFGLEVGKHLSFELIPRVLDNQTVSLSDITALK